MKKKDNERFFFENALDQKFLEFGEDRIRILVPPPLTFLEVAFEVRFNAVDACEASSCVQPEAVNAMTCTSPSVSGLPSLRYFFAHLVNDFLDVIGAWNPALALVMGGAILVAAPFFGSAAAVRELIGLDVTLPETQLIDARLLAGAAILAIGRELTGVCPCPGARSARFDARGAVLLVLAMVLGPQIAGA